MLANTKTYTPADRQVLAKDLNTFGQAVRILNNITGRNVFVDGTGIHFRTPPAPAVAEEDAPEFYGQVHMGVANLTPGWSLLPLVNLTP